MPVRRPSGRTSAAIASAALRRGTCFAAAALLAAACSDSAGVRSGADTEPSGGDPTLDVAGLDADAGAAADGADAAPDSGSDARSDAAPETDAGAADTAPGDDAAAQGDAPPADAGAVAACAQRATGTWLVTRFEFVGTGEGGRTEGFDIDDRVSTAADTEGCGKPDATAPDGTRGIDNQFATLIPLLHAIGVDLDALINQRVREGTLLLVVRMDGEFGACRGLSFQRGAGEVLADTDGAPTSHQTLSLEPGATVSTANDCSFDDACTGSATGDSLVIEFTFISNEIRLEFIAWRSAFQVDDRGSLDGLIGGAVSLDSVMAIVNSLGGCGDERIRDAIAPVIPRAADVFPDESGACQGLSGALRIEAVPVYLFED